MKQATTHRSAHDVVRELWSRIIGRGKKQPHQRIEPGEFECCVCELWGSATCPTCSPEIGIKP
jgi:hypothetical protein